MKDLIAKYESLMAQTAIALTEIRNYKDGFVYLICTYVHRYPKWSIVNNMYALTEYMDTFNWGEDGIIDVFSNNPDINTWSNNTGGSTEFMSIGEMHNLVNRNMPNIDSLRETLAKIA